MQILFGILAILCGIGGSILFGVIGMAITVVFAVLAIIFGVNAKKKGGSSAAGVITAILGIVFGLIGTIVMVVAGSELSKQAKEQNLPIMSEYGESLTFGVVGFAMKIANTDFDLDQVKDELDKLNKTTTATTTEAQ